MSDKNKQSTLTELPKEVRWQFEEAVLKARPLCDAIARLEAAILQLICSTACSNIIERQFDPDRIQELGHSYCKDAIAAAKDRWEWALQRGECSPVGGERLIKEIVELLSNRK